MDTDDRSGEALFSVIVRFLFRLSKLSLILLALFGASSAQNGTTDRKPIAAVKNGNIPPVAKLPGSVKGKVVIQRYNPAATQPPRLSTWTVKVGTSSVHPDQFGKYTIAGLPPGNYTVTVEGRDPCYIPANPNRSVTVRPTKTSTVNLYFSWHCPK